MQDPSVLFYRGGMGVVPSSWSVIGEQFGGLSVSLQVQLRLIPLHSKPRC